MPLRLPSEIVVDELLPALRSGLAQALSRRGMTQEQIAEILGVSQPAVSRYVHGRVDVAPELADDPQLARTVDDLADRLADDRIDEVDLLAEVMQLVGSMEDRGPVCRIHEREMPALEGLGCDLCVQGHDSAVIAERDVLAAVRRGVRRLEQIPGVARHVPNVGTNLGVCLDGADRADDVAAIPGRIYVLRDRLQVPAAPEFGTSRHVADVVLAAHAADAGTRAATNLATSEALLSAADELDLDAVAFDADYDGRRDRLRDTFEERGVPDLAYHEGAFGIEPIAYVLGGGAVDVVERVETLVRA